MHPERLALNALVEQLTNLLQQINRTEYTQPIDLFDGSSIGGHCRHIFEFLQILEQGMSAGLLDYGARQRTPELEKDPLLLVAALEKSYAALNQYSLTQSVHIIADVPLEDSSFRPQHASTFGRELLFVFYHTVHHLAMIKMGLKYLNSPVQLPAHFGVAPSTIAFQDSSHKHE